MIPCDFFFVAILGINYLLWQQVLCINQSENFLKTRNTLIQDSLDSWLSEMWKLTRPILFDSKMSLKTRRSLEGDNEWTNLDLQHNKRKKLGKHTSRMAPRVTWSDSQTPISHGSMRDLIRLAHTHLAWLLAWPYQTRTHPPRMVLRVTWSDLHTPTKRDVAHPTLQHAKSSSLKTGNNPFRFFFSH